MLSWWPWVLGAFVLSILSAYGLLRLRCRGVGYLFGPRARPWAVTIIMVVAIISTGLGVALAAVTHSIGAAYISLVIPGGLRFIKFPPEHLVPRTLGLTLPFSRLYDGMGDDMQTWCDVRLKAASPNPQWIADGVNYYYEHVEGRLKDSRARARLADWRDSIMHKISIVRLISLDTAPARLRESLQKHPSTRNVRTYGDDDLPRLARRLESDALNELNLFLAYIYRLGYHKLLIYPFRPSAHRAPRFSTDEPGARKSSATEAGRRET
jgi:hypothetical protein